MPWIQEVQALQVGQTLQWLPEVQQLRWGQSHQGLPIMQANTFIII